MLDRWEAWQQEGTKEFYEARGILDDKLRALGKTSSVDRLNVP